MFFYSMNIPDYRKDTSHLKPIEHYIYRSLIDQYYSDERAIPNKIQWVMRRLSLEGAEHEQMLENVLNDFFMLSIVTNASTLTLKSTIRMPTKTAKMVQKAADLAKLTQWVTSRILMGCQW